MTSTGRPGRLAPRAARLHSRSVVLKRGAVMSWHSTGRREELIVVLQGRLALQVRSRQGRVRSRPVASGEAVFVPPGTAHQVANASRASARYVYVTG